MPMSQTPLPFFRPSVWGLDQNGARIPQRTEGAPIRILPAGGDGQGRAGPHEEHLLGRIPGRIRGRIRSRRSSRSQG